MEGDLGKDCEGFELVSALFEAVDRNRDGLLQALELRLCGVSVLVSLFVFPFPVIREKKGKGESERERR